MITISKVNETYIKVNAEKSTLLNLQERFSFMANNYKHHPKYRAGIWDGRLKLFNLNTRQIYHGLLNSVTSFLREYDDDIQFVNFFEKRKEVSNEDVKEFIKSLNVPSHIETREYQIDAIREAINHDRGIFISPTASGKSFIIYVTMMYYMTQIDVEQRILIIVPRLSLVSQMFTDFESYGFNSEKFIHKITGGVDKHVKKKITLSTWQSLKNLEADYFLQYGLLLGDEVHTFAAKCLTYITESLINCQFRFGFTGTLDGSTVSEMTLNGLFGPTYQVTTTKELMDDGYVANLNIKVISLTYPDEVKKIFHQTKSKIKYPDEVKYILENKKRTKFIANLVNSLEGNTLVFYRFIEHGKHLYEEISRKTNKKVHLINGSTDTDTREEIRSIVNDENDVIVIASLGTTSTGINYINLQNIVFTSPSKSRINILQSIGRGLRKAISKTSVNLYDIADDICYKKKKNYSYIHLIERLRLYVSEQFKYKIYNYKLYE